MTDPWPNRSTWQVARRCAFKLLAPLDYVARGPGEHAKRGGDQQPQGALFEWQLRHAVGRWR